MTALSMKRNHNLLIITHLISFIKILNRRVLMISRIIKNIMKNKKTSIQPPDLHSYSYSQSVSHSFSISKQKNNPITKQQPLPTLQKILSWRRDNVAPVDVVGCERLADKEAPIEVQKYQTLIALMLSIQTKDEITGMVMERLKKYGLNPQNIVKLSEDELVQMIRQSNFNRRKAKNILEVSKRISEDGIAKTKEDLLKYPGVGVKISMIYLRVAEGQNTGIGVDTHVHRIANRLGWVNTKNPNETEQSLQCLFSPETWKDINVGLVGFGQTLCEAKKPQCGKCPVGKDCPSYRELF